MKPDQWSLVVAHHRGPGRQSLMPGRWIQTLWRFKDLCGYMPWANTAFCIVRLRLLRQGFLRPDQWIRAFARWYGGLDVPGLESRLRAERIHCGTFESACRGFCEWRASLEGGLLADHYAHHLAEHLHDHLDSVFGMAPGKRSFGHPLANVGLSRVVRSIYGWRERDFVEEQMAARESKENLRLQLTVGRKLREGTVWSFAVGVHPNPRFYKYSWRIFVAPPGRENGSMKLWTCAMPELTHAEFRRQHRWLRENRIECHISNVRQRRRHPIWDPNTWRDENLSPSFDEDTDEMGIDGHK